MISCVIEQDIYSAILVLSYTFWKYYKQEQMEITHLKLTLSLLDCGCSPGLLINKFQSVFTAH